MDRDGHRFVNKRNISKQTIVFFYYTDDFFLKELEKPAGFKNDFFIFELLLTNDLTEQTIYLNDCSIRKKIDGK